MSRENMLRAANLFRKDKPPALLQLRSSAGLIVTTASFAVFTDIFLYAVIVPVLPFALSERAGINEEDVQYWVSISLAVYGAALLVASPLWGYFADRVRNRKYPMLVGLVLLGGATVFLCVARNIPLLLIGRALQGITAALTWTVGLSLVIDTVDAKHVGVATGWIGMATSLGVLLAPLLGGVVYGRGGYYSVFAMCFGLIAVDIVLRLSIIEVREAKKWLDATDSTGPSGLEKGAEADNQNSDAIPPSVSQLREEQSTPSPITAAQEKSQPSGLVAIFGPFIGLLRKPRLLAALWGTLVHAILQTSFDSTLPLLVESIFHWDSIGAGLVFLPLVLPTFLSPIVGFLGDKYGPKWLASGGFLLAAPFLICLRFVEENDLRHKIMICGLLFGVGLAIACVFGPLMAEITWSVLGDGESENREEDLATAPYAQAYGLYNMAFSGGSLVGPILGGFIRDEAGWPTVCWAMGLITAVTAVISVIWVGRPVAFFKRQNI